MELLKDAIAVLIGGVIAPILLWKLINGVSNLFDKLSRR